MLNYVQILLFTLAVLAILSFSERGAARSSITITNGCYMIASKRTCPSEISGFVPVSAGPNDVFFIDLFGNITGPGQQQQQQQTIQQVEPVKGGKLPPTNPTQQGNPTGQTGQDGALVVPNP